jgi:hypothetical protein
VCYPLLLDHGTRHLDLSSSLGGQLSWTHISSYGKKESSYGKKESSYGKKESSYGKKESSYGKKESSYGKKGRAGPAKSTISAFAGTPCNRQSVTTTVGVVDSALTL